MCMLPVCSLISSCGKNVLNTMGLVTVLCCVLLCFCAMDGQDVDLPFLPQLVNLVSDDSDMDDSFLISQHDQMMANVSFDLERE